MADTETTTQEVSVVKDETSEEVATKDVKSESSEATKTEEVVENGTQNGHAESPEEEAPKSDESPKTEEAKEDEAGSPETETAAPADEVKEEKEEPIPKVTLYQFPPGKHIPSLSPFCLKLETFLRLNKIPYESSYSYNKMSKKGKVPWIEYKGERKADSSFIIEYLTEKFETTLDSELSVDDKALGRVVKVTLEENSYNALLYNRYIDTFNDYKKLISPVNAGLGFNVSQKMVQRRVRHALDAQGMGRHLKEEVYQIAKDDIKAVSQLLGEKSFLFGENPSSFDCTVFGFFANVLWCGMESPLATFVKEEAQNLVGLCERMKEQAWPDWNDMVQGEKQEPTIKKGFSFRKKRTPKKAKEPEATEESVEKSEGKDEETKTEEKTEEGEKSEATEEQKEDTAEKVEEKPSEESTPEAEKPETDTVADKLTETTQNGTADASLIKSEE